MQKPTQERGFLHFVDRADKPNSVVGDHLSGPAITCKLERHSPSKWSTALHTGKDLFVAPLRLPGELILLRELDAPCFRSWASLWAPLSLRTTGVTRYLPQRGLPKGSFSAACMFGLSSPRLPEERSSSSVRLQLYHTNIYMNIC